MCLFIHAAGNEMKWSTFYVSPCIYIYIYTLCLSVFPVSKGKYSQNILSKQAQKTSSKKQNAEAVKAEQM